MSDNETRRSGWGGLLVVIAAAAGAALVYFLHWGRPPVEDAPPPPVAEKAQSGRVKFLMEQQWIVHMRLAQVEMRVQARQITATGRVVAAPGLTARVSTPVSGLLEAEGGLPRVGQRVSAGQLVAAIREAPTAAEYAQLRAAAAQVEAQNAQVRAQNAQIAVEKARLAGDVQAARGDLAQARVRRDLARIEADRAARMYALKAFSRRQLQAARADYDAAQAAWLAAGRRLAALTAARVPSAVEPATSDVMALRSHAVVAPLSGYVTRVAKAPGEQVIAGETILELLDLDVVYVEAPVFERDLGRLGRNRAARFTTPAWPGREFTGLVEDVGAVIDAKTRTATVLFKVLNAGHPLRVGMQADVRLDAGERKSVCMVPKEAVLEAEGKKMVYVLLSGEEFERREVTTGDEYGDRLAIPRGLKAGERVVTQGAYQIRQHELRPGGAPAHSHET